MTKTSEWKGQSRGGAIGHRIFIFILKHLGLPPAYFILRFVAAYYLIFAPKATRNTYNYFKDIQKFSSWKAFRYVYKTYYRFGQTLLDKVVIFAGLPNKFTFFFDGEHHLREIVSRGKGAILISAHLGNWEIASHFLKKLNTPVNVVLFDGEREEIKKTLSRVMVKKKYNMIAVKPDFSHLFQIHQALKNGEIICIHGDRYLKEFQSKTYTANFLGEKARFPVGPFQLASRLRIPYTFVFAIKETNTHYHFYATAGKTKENPREILEDYIAGIEKVLLTAPEQWFNFYNFWEDSDTEKKA